MTLVTRGLGKKFTSGVAATLVAAGLGISISQIPVQPQQIIQPSAGFLQDGPIVVVSDKVTNIVYNQFSLIDIIVEGKSGAIVFHTETAPIETTSYSFITNLNLSEIEVNTKYSYKNYYKELHEIEDEAFLLDSSFIEIEYPKLTYNNYRNITNIDIKFTGKSIISNTYSDEIKKQIKEEEELLLFNNLII